MRRQHGGHRVRAGTRDTPPLAALPLATPTPRSPIKASLGPGEGPALPVGHDATVSTCKMAAHHRQNTAGRRKVQVRARRGRRGSRGARSLAGHASGCRMSGLGGFYGGAVAALSPSSAAVRGGSAARPRGLSPPPLAAVAGPSGRLGQGCGGTAARCPGRVVQPAGGRAEAARIKSTGGGEWRPRDPCPLPCFGVT